MRDCHLLEGLPLCCELFSWSYRDTRCHGTNFATWTSFPIMAVS